MKPELTLLVWATLLTLVQAVIAVQGALMQLGLPKLAGNREGMPEIAGWGGGAGRAHPNKFGEPGPVPIPGVGPPPAHKTNGNNPLGAAKILASCSGDA